jgi:hypothetical protein
MTQMANESFAWTVAGGIENASFEMMTVMPSIDGSAGGLWHGFITNGEIVGGFWSHCVASSKSARVAVHGGAGFCFTNQVLRVKPNGVGGRRFSDPPASSAGDGGLREQIENFSSPEKGVSKRRENRAIFCR